MSKKILGVVLILFMACLLIAPTDACADNAAVSIVRVSGGVAYALALKSDGTVTAWGKNTYGQCNVPAGLTGVVAVAAGSAGGSHSLALKNDGTVTAWGLDNYNQCDVPAGLTGVVAIAAGEFHSLALKSDGTVTAWGLDNYNQCDVPAGLSNVTAVAGGYAHSLALKSDGTVTAWGWDYYNQRDVPSGLSGVTAIAAGLYHSLALKSDGTVVAWGRDNQKQCDVPSGLTGVVGIAAGANYSLALKNDGTVVAWGYNGDHECNVPSGLGNVVKVAAGNTFSIALQRNGTLVAWGDNGSGETTIPSGLNLANLLSSLTLSQGTLAPFFSSGAFTYTAAVDNSISSIDVTPTAFDGAGITVDGAVVSSGATCSVPLAVGDNVITVGASTSDGLSDTYTVTVTRSGASSDATLNGLTLSGGALSPDFASGNTSYTAAVANGVSSITVTPTANNANATITVNGQAVTSGSASQAISLSVGANTVSVVVTAQDGLTTQTYTVTVTRAEDATLSSLTISSGTLAPAFAPGTTGYTDSVSNTMHSVTVTPTADTSGETITVNGTAVVSGAASQAIGLNVGANTITVVVTAPDGLTTQAYTVTVTRSGPTTSYAFNGIPFKVAGSGTFNGTLFVDGGHGLPSSYGQPYTQKFLVPAGTVTWARLYVGVWGGIPTTSGVLNVNFNGNTLGTAGMGQGQTTGIADMVEGSGDGVWWVAINVTGDLMANSENTAVLDATDPNNTGFDTRIYGVVLVAAVAQDGGPTVSYQVAEGNECLNYITPLNSYTLAFPSLAGAIAPGSVAKADLETVYLTGHPNTGDSLSLNNDLLSANADDGSGSSLDTNNSPSTWTNNYFGLHDWNVAGMTAQHNTVVFQRGNQSYMSPVLAILTTQASSDASLRDLTLSSGTLSPAFDASTTNYTATVDSGVDSITVTPTVNDANAAYELQVDGNSVSNPVSLSVGDNVIDVVVTAQDGTQETYAVTVTRATAPKDTDATLSNLTVGGTTITGFTPGILTYNVTLPAGTTTVPTVTATVNDAGKANAVVTPAASLPGATTVLVTAEDGAATQTYTVNFTVATTPAQSYTVTYDGNGAIGAVPTDSNTYAAGATVTVLGQGSLAAPSNDTFGGWSTAPNAGTSYKQGDQFQMGSANVTLYAVWNSGVGTESFPILSATPSYFEATK